MVKKDGIATKNFVKAAIKDSEDRLVGLITSVNEQLHDEIKNQTKSVRNEVVERLDSILGEIKDFREEFTVLSYHSGEHFDQLQDHEKRIKKLEGINLQ